MVQRTLTRPEAEASRLLQRAQVTFADYGEPWPGYKVDVDLLAGLVFELGIQAVSDLRVGSREYAAFLKADSKLIVVEANHHEHRRRFSIAHEIGHYVLHYLPKTTPQSNFHCSSGDMELSSMPGTQAPSLMHHHLRQEWEASVCWRATHARRAGAGDV
jgi:hypothetical protein